MKCIFRSILTLVFLISMIDITCGINHSNPSRDIDPLSVQYKAPEQLDSRMKKEYQVTNLTDRIATNARLLRLNDSTMLVYTLTIIGDQHEKPFKTQYPDSSKQQLAHNIINTPFPSKQLVPILTDWKNNWYGDFNICSSGKNNGYIIAPSLGNPLSGTAEDRYRLSLYRWNDNDGTLSVNQLQIKNALSQFSGYTPDICNYHGNIIGTYQSASYNGTLNIVNYNEKSNSIIVSPIDGESGLYPRLLPMKDRLCIFFSHDKGYYHSPQDSKLSYISSVDLMKWEKHKDISDSTGVLQVSPIMDGEGNIIVLYSIQEKYIGSTSSVSNELLYTCAINANVLTKLWLTWSTDNGQNWAVPVSITDGSHADHYPELIVLNKHLQLFWTRFISNNNEDPYKGTVAGNIYTSDYGELDNIMHPSENHQKQINSD